MNRESQQHWGDLFSGVDLTRLKFSFWWRHVTFELNSSLFFCIKVQWALHSFSYSRKYSQASDRKTQAASRQLIRWRIPRGQDTWAGKNVSFLPSLLRWENPVLTVRDPSLVRYFHSPVRTVSKMLSTTKVMRCIRIYGLTSWAESKHVISEECKVKTKNGLPLGDITSSLSGISRWQQGG